MKVTNVGTLLTESAKRIPDQVAVAVSKSTSSKRKYQQVGFRELNEQTDRIAAGLLEAGARRGMRLALLVRPGIEFIQLVFAMFKSGVVTILIDPGMGRKNMIRCLSEANPDGFVAIPAAHIVRCFLRKRFPNARFNVTVGRRLFWGGKTLKQIEKLGLAVLSKGDRSTEQMFAGDPDDAAAIIFTTGSTGPPKGVLYSHRNFLQQVEEIRDYYQIEPGGVDISGFPLFALFNAGMGMTTVVPKMDFTKPADVDPNEIIAAVNDWSANQSFGSPALWTTVGRYCEKRQIRLPTLKRVLTAGAPVPPHVLKRLKSIVGEEGEIYTPYGATEALPVASMDASTVIEETAAQTEQGKGVCVGKRFPGIECKVIEITDEPIADISQVRVLEPGAIGELMVRGGVVTKEYVTRTDANALHKVQDGETIWHRMGDVGYFDSQDRFWFCGRKGHRVVVDKETMFTIPCEAVFNKHEDVYRTALVGVDTDSGTTPVLVVECWPESKPESSQAESRLFEELKELGLANDLTQSIQNFFLIDKMPVDIRHNSKIFREKLREWAAKQMGILGT